MGLTLSEYLSLTLVSGVVLFSLSLSSCQSCGFGYSCILTLIEGGGGCASREGVGLRRPGAKGCARWCTKYILYFFSDLRLGRRHLRFGRYHLRLVADI